MKNILSILFVSFSLFNFSAASATLSEQLCYATPYQDTYQTFNVFVDTSGNMAHGAEEANLLWTTLYPEIGWQIQEPAQMNVWSFAEGSFLEANFTIHPTKVTPSGMYGLAKSTYIGSETSFPPLQKMELSGGAVNWRSIEKELETSMRNGEKVLLIISDTSLYYKKDQQFLGNLTSFFDAKPIAYLVGGYNSYTYNILQNIFGRNLFTDYDYFSFRRALVKQ